VNPRKTALRVAATSGLAAIVCGMVAAPAVAADGDVDVVNTETVQVYTSPTGEVETQRVYEQLILTGTGSVDLTNPISTDGLRNLEGFDGVDVEGGDQVTEMTVDGEEHLRTVSDFEGDLPLDVSVSYKLDGETVEPGDIVGESGELEVLYTVRNITGQPQEVSFPDGRGGTTTATVDVPIPMVGSLTTVAPESFTNVHSDQANMAGDGKGGTKLSFTMTLFPPIGSDTAEFGYTADIADGVVPRSDVSALPVNPLESPTFAAAADSYQGGTDTGAKLAEGAATIDSNLLKLRDGAAELLGGLIKLRDGSERLEAGLAEEAAPGAERLADGAGQLDDGLGRIADGANRLFDGTGQLVAGTGDLTDGTGRLADGAGRLSEGAGRLDAGLGKLDRKVSGDLAVGANDLAEGQRNLAEGLKLLYEGVDALPETVTSELNTDPRYLTLLGTLDKIVAGIGTPESTGVDTLMGGLFQVRSGLRIPTGVPTDCELALAGGTPARCGVADAAALMQGLLPAKKTQLECASKILADLAGGAAVDVSVCPLPAPLTSPLPDVIHPVPEAQAAQRGVLNTLSGQLSAGAADLDKFAGGLQLIQSGVDGRLIPGINAIRKALYNAPCNPAQTDKTAADFCGVAQAVSLIREGVPTLVDGILSSIEQKLLAKIGQPTKGCEPTETLRCGAAALAAGGGDLTKGVDKLVAGVAKLSNGGSLLSDGATQLADGTDELDAGANQLAAGAGELNAGAGKLADGTAEAADGSGQLADGAGRLAEGLVDAAEGSGRLSAGLGKAADGAPKLVDGAQMLSDKGTSKLVEAGEDTTQTYGQMYATMRAGAERAQTEDMAYGAPEGAAGLTAYSYVIQGEDGEAGRNWARGLAGMALLGLGGGGFLLRRRLV
jgi:putative membrane protein